MSVKHPIVAITGSSGAGTSTVTKSFDLVFRREKLKAAIVEGDSFHRFDRKAMKVAMEEARQQGNNHFSHFGLDANLIDELENLFRTYGETGAGRRRYYLHNDEEAAPYKQESGTDTSMKAGTNFDIEATANLSAKGVQTTVEGSATLTAKGGMATFKGTSMAELSGGLVKIN